MKPRWPLAHAPFVAVAGLSARLLAQSATRAGLRVAALDIFGDRDTREAAGFWFDIGGGSGALAVDRARLVDALARVARLPHLVGWVGGSGLEPLMAQLCGEPGLPRFLGNDAAAIAAVREPRRFFALLDELRIPHPDVSFERPASAESWLLKLADGCGGTHIQPAAALDAVFDAAPDAVPSVVPDAEPHAVPDTVPNTALASAPGYFQRIGHGRPLSALFIGAEGRAHLIGFAEQLTCAIGDRDFVHAGSIGPIEMPPPAAARIEAALDALCARTGLVGINSCDFLFDGAAFDVLEINARPSSTMTLYETASPDAWPRGLLACHLDACRFGRPPPSASLALARRPRACAGQQVLFAPAPFTVSEAFSDACLRDPQCRDVPMPGTRIEAGQPVCTLLVRVTPAGAVQHVRAALDAQRARVVQRIETCNEPDYAFIHSHS
ncbi:ATP-grasp domain-containing protein [Paraburkholderia susongensis]|uniref:Predicted ATP-dependent carboligase, ATP-grasp superfamily n=1 Tax=Paraburkholderia susongensis TaxID=1515439 RepID=A0A1X7M358_9BURK|nr:ATP-grasp domain-containing protein [Paraburkholderia susongensis]SMG59829.1 Predicted ATP-dependent carboligase, ATP-grasp superfamily [Paraburkholderia susongensis]